ncbi:hypothetical protein HQ585_18410 [candidate division KSB1 bacterium]|nr:hypothetical protein [candidate division KSB1 bacterium]
MKKNLVSVLLLSLFALIFTIALTYAAIELPNLPSSFLIDQFEFPGFDSGRQIVETEAYIQSNQLRWIGYGSLAIVLVLIIVGFVTEKRGLSLLGAVAVFLPVFGHFAFSMFFLASLGFLRVIWLPFLDVSYDVLTWGEIVYLPYMAIVYVPVFLGLEIRTAFAFYCMGVGILLFIAGVIAWSYVRFQKKITADIWVYRFSRHPQYLGWILWSYGVLIYVSLHSNLYQFKISYGVPSSLPWLISTLVIVGVAMIEEVKMKQDGRMNIYPIIIRHPF